MAVRPSSERAERLARWVRGAAWLHLPAALGWLMVMEWTGGLLDALAWLGAYTACKEMDRFVNLNCVVNYFIANLFLLLLLGLKSAALLAGQPFGLDSLAHWQYQLSYVVGVYGILLHSAGTALGYALFGELRRIGTEEGLAGPGAAAPADGGDADTVALVQPPAEEAGGFRAFQGKGYSLR